MITPRERMRAAMERGVSERTPVMCQLALGHYFLHAGDGLEIWHDSEAFARALVTLQRRYRFDGILVNLPGRDPGWRERIERIESDDGLRRVHWGGGLITVVPDDDSPYVLGDGRRFRLPWADLDPEQLFYVEPHDPCGVTYPTRWSFRDVPAELGGPEFFPPWQCDTLRRVRELTSGEISVHAEVFSPFSQLMELCQHQECLMAMLLEPDKVDATLRRLCDGACVLGELYAAAGCDALLISSAFVGGGFLSRAHYQRFELPHLERIVRAAKSRCPGLPVYLHTCGAIGDRLDLMANAGVDGIDTFDPPPIGNVELSDAVRQLKGRVFIKGNLDPVHELLRCESEASLHAARERLRIAAAGGGYVLSSACSVPPHAPPENIEQLAVAVDEASDG